MWRSEDNTDPSRLVVEHRVCLRLVDGQRRGPDAESPGRVDLQIRVGAQWQVRPTIALGLCYEFVYVGDLSVSQNRGPLAGQVSGEFPNVTMHFFAFTLNWGSQGRAYGTGRRSSAERLISEGGDADIAQAWRVGYEPRAESHLSGRLFRTGLYVGSDHGVYAEASFIQYHRHGAGLLWPYLKRTRHPILAATRSVLRSLSRGLCNGLPPHAPGVTSGGGVTNKSAGTGIRVYPHENRYAQQYPDRDPLRTIRGCAGRAIRLQPRLAAFTQTLYDQWKVPGIESTSCEFG